MDVLAPGTVLVLSCLEVFYVLLPLLPLPQKPEIWSAVYDSSRDSLSTGDNETKAPGIAESGAKPKVFPGVGLPWD